MLGAMFAPTLARTLATAVPIGPRGGTPMSAFAVAAVILFGMLAYTWVATRLEARRRRIGGPNPPGARTDGGHARARHRAREPEPLIDSLLRDLEDARRDKGMVKAARRRIRASRRSRRPPPPPG
jgi:hypothetical protein